MSYEVAGHYDKYLMSRYPLAKIRIYCPPCRVAIKTGLLLCSRLSGHKVNYVVCVDDRLQSSCCRSNEMVQRLQDMHQTLREYDGELLGQTVAGCETGLLQHLDRLHLEKRLYRLEEMVLGDVHNNTSAKQRLVDLWNEAVRNSRGFITLFPCEAGGCGWGEMKSFPRLPRSPAESEIFRIWKPLKKVPKLEYFGTFTPRKFPVPPSFSSSAIRKDGIPSSPALTGS